MRVSFHRLAVLANTPLPNWAVYWMLLTPVLVLLRPSKFALM